MEQIAPSALALYALRSSATGLPKSTFLSIIWHTLGAVAPLTNIRTRARTTNKKMKSKDSNKETDLEARADEYLAGWKRAKADLENYKKEESSRLDNVRKFACEGLILEMLTVLDSFNFALASSKDEETKKGVLMIKSQLEEALKRSGLEKIEVKVGDIFNESLHEAMEGDGDKISEIVSEGYKLQGKLVRAAKVKLGKGQN